MNKYHITLAGRYIGYCIASEADLIAAIRKGAKYPNNLTIQIEGNHIHAWQGK